jgi:hypothetical protein
VPSNSDLTLGFVGEEAVHSANSRALLEDFIAAHKRMNPTAKIRFLFPADGFSDTLEDLADFCLTSGYDLGMVGASQDSKVVEYMESASKVFGANDGSRYIAQRLLPHLPNPRLIILGDPAEDDHIYSIVELAVEGKVPVRSLLKGLDSVLIDEEESETEESVAADDWDDDDAEEAGLHVVEDEDEELEDDEDEDVEVDDESEDEDEEIEDEEIEEDDESEDEEEDVTDEEEEDGDEEDGDEEEDDESEDEESEEDVEWEDDEEEDEEDEESDDEEDEEEVTVPTGKRLSESQLLALAERDRDAFYALAKKHKIYPGRGVRVTTMVKGILEANGQKVSDAVAHPRLAAGNAKKRTVKTATRTKKTVEAAPVRKKKVAPARTARVAKATRPAKKVSTGRRPGRPANAVRSSAPATASLDRSALKAFIKVAQAALEVAQSQL